MKKHLTRGDYIHKELPKTKKDDDFWGQVSRTLNGVPVSQKQIDMIISTISRALNFQKTDKLLDIGCGNGALSQYFFEMISEFRGVDFSKHLIKIAKKYFEQPPKYIFTKMDALTFVQNDKNKKMYTKALIYGAFMYLSPKNAFTLLEELNKSYTQITRIFIGNLPDKEKSELFFKDKNYTCSLDDHSTPFGVWRSKDEFKNLAESTGWEIEFSQMPKNFYSSYYRYDVILKRKKYEKKI